MPFEQAIWRIDNRLTRLSTSAIAKEVDLERFVEEDVSILNPGWLIIGRQVSSDVGPIDLLAMDRTGALILIELKRHQTTRDVTAQALDYASWAEKLTSDEIAGIYSRYCEKYLDGRRTTLDDAFRGRFDTSIPAEEINHTLQIVIVASELDARTERIVRYLSGRGIDINVLCFQIFADGASSFLSRVWLLDAVEIEEQVTRNRSENLSEWNGEYYVSFGLGEGENRNWDEARKYGFISAGGGRWYSATLQLLTPGSRIWVNIPGHGYVGVGEVIGACQRASEFQISEDGSLKYILDVSKSSETLSTHADNSDLSEYYVPIKWIKTVPLEQAIREVGFFGNQNSVCKPRAAKWVHTVERLKKLFDVK